MWSALVVSLTILLSPPSHPSPEAVLKGLDSSGVWTDLVTVMHHISSYYVEPQRIQPHRLFSGGLRVVSLRTPEVQVLGKGGSWVITVGKRSITVPQPHALWELAISSLKALTFIRQNLPQDVRKDKVIYSFLSGMLSELDPHSYFIDPERSEEHRIHTEGEFGGIGTTISICDGLLTAVSVMKNGPAYKAGVRDGDKILFIDGEDTSYMTLSEAVSKLRGKVGTKVRLVIGRKKGRRLRKKRITITRGKIKIDETTGKVLTVRGHKIGYIKIPSFQMLSPDQMKDALKHLTDEKVKGIVLDLRDNGGGLVASVLTMLNYFISEGVLLVTLGAHEYEQDLAEGKAPLYEGPLVVLVNAESASAAEIMTAALKYFDKAIVIGTRTFGKASVQRVFGLPDSSFLALTIARYYVKGDIAIQGYGIDPDIETNAVLLDAAPARKIVYYEGKRIDYHESDYYRVLSSKLSHPGDSVSYRVWLLGKKEKSENECNYCGSDQDVVISDLDDAVQDSVMALAAEVLAAWPKGAGRQKALSAMASTIRKFQKEEDLRITRTVGKRLGIDWSPGSVSQASLDIRLKIPRLTMDSSKGAWGTITVTVTNTGRKAVPRLHAIVRATSPYLDHQELLFGRVEPQKSITKKLVFKYPYGTAPGVDVVDVFLYSDTKYLGIHRTGMVRLEVPNRPVPTFSYKIKEIGDGDGLLEKGEKAYVEVTVTNAGAGPMGEASLVLKNKSWPSARLSGAKLPIYFLGAGKSRTGRFTIKAKGKMPKEGWRFRFHYEDCNYSWKFSSPLSFVRVKGTTGSYTPPTLKVKLTEKVQNGRLPITITASDPDGLRDVYVILSPRKLAIPDHKAFYRWLDGRKEATLSISVPVPEGLTMVLVYARDIHKNRIRSRYRVVYFKDYSNIRWE